MRKDIQFLSQIYLSNITPENKLEIFSRHFFRFATKKVSDRYKQAKVIGFIKELDSLLFMPKNEFESFGNNVDDIIYNLDDKDYELVQKLADYINARYEAYIDGKCKVSKYQGIFEEWALNIHPSHQNKNGWTHNQITQAQNNINRLKNENKDLYNFISKTCLRYNTSVNLIMFIASKTLFLTPTKDKDTYQFNLKNDTVIKCIEEYLEITNSKSYANLYDKISLIRSCLNELSIFCFSKNFDYKKGEYLLKKYHSRVLFKLTKSSTKVYETKSLYNDYITLSNITYLLHKYSILQHFITSKNKIKNYFNIKRKQQSNSS